MTELPLLPQPRSLSVGREVVPWATPRVAIDRAGLPAQGYRLQVSPAGEVLVEAGDDAGAFYARATLAQLAAAFEGSLPVCSVEDWPDFAVRGVLLDVSRDKVPTMETLFGLVDRLASWKVNQLHLYLEHTFAYADHAEVWRDASPLTAEEIRELDRYCAERFVELVPNQNCLGHWERWLRHDRYRPLAVAPDGFPGRRGRLHPPATLDPSSPAALALVRSLLAELLPNFGSRRVHVGLDEPKELPEDRFGDYVDWIRALRSAPEVAGRELLLWGDVFAMAPSLLADLPEGVTVCEWGYESWYPFAQQAATLAEAGVPFWVCPGTSSWLSLVGRWTNMRECCLAAASAGMDGGAAGFLNTDWGDLGHLQHLPVTEAGLAWGAAVSWCRSANGELSSSAFARLVSAVAFGDATGSTGRALEMLGDLYRAVTPQFPNISTLVTHLYYPQLQLDRGLTAGITAGEVDAVVDRLDAASALLADARPTRADGPQVLAELAHAVALLRVLCADAHARLAADGWLASVPAGVRASLAASLEPVVDEHASLWLARNRPGGLPDSLAWLHNLRSAYETGTCDWGWGGW